MVCIYLIKVSMMREVKRVLKSMIIFITELSFIQKKKKKKMLRLQQFYNIFTTNHEWLVIIGSNLNLAVRLLF